MIVSALFFFVVLPATTSAKINITVDRFYEITEDEKMRVTETHRIVNNTENQYIPANESFNFQILAFRVDDAKSQEILQNALNSLTIKELGVIRNYTKLFEDKNITITVPYSKSVYPGESRTFKIEYTHEGLISRNGAVLDAYIHAFAPDFQFSNNTTEYKFNTKLVVPKSFPELNFVFPKPQTIKDDKDSTSYIFSQESLIDHFGWIQLGRKQVYDFTITQDIYATESILTGLRNRYEIILPRDMNSAEVSQVVEFLNITPAPISTYLDDEENLIGIFEFPSNENEVVIIKGYALIKKKDNIDYANLVQNQSKISQTVLQKYTQPATYWEVDSQKIQDTARKYYSPTSNVFQITSDVYNFIVDSIDYSDVKRFGINVRQGALNTLNGGSAVCMEYSDLFLTLMRANGIPTRAAFGYGFDPRVPSESQEGHQWVQVYMPGLNEPWVDVDVTWGESGDMLIGGDLNHFYTHVAYKDPNTPSMISRFAYGNNKELKPPKFEISTIKEIPKDSTLISQKELLSKYPQINETTTEFLANQIKGRFQAGYKSLKTGFDFNNPSQLLFIGTLITGVLLVLVAIKLMVKVTNR